MCLMIFFLTEAKFGSVSNQISSITLRIGISFAQKKNSSDVPSEFLRGQSQSEPIDLELVTLVILQIIQMEKKL